ncbi:nuclear transport factor 2 family protein [Kitasatospora phosalacinea]|uniref:nuclear transport factor 2 family protein n=1 Tax=Kitasatospora phosalacinea TaxID=2065 RepID=UPI0035D8B118
MPTHSPAGLADRTAVSELLDRYLADFDSLPEHPRDDDWYRTLFTEDLALTFPVGGHRGVPGLDGFQRAAKARWGRTQHISSNHVVELDRDTALLTAQLLVTHVHRAAAPPLPHFTAGSRVRARAVRTERGWRLGELTIELIWTAGQPPR